MRHETKVLLATPASVSKEAVKNTIIGQTELHIHSWGYSEMRAFGKVIQSFRPSPDIFHSSEQNYARETLFSTLIGADIRPVTYEVHPALNERSHGAHEGRRKIAVFGNNFDTHAAQLLIEQGVDYRPPGKNLLGNPGESIRDVTCRMVGYLAGLRAEEEPPKFVVAISHERPIQALLAYISIGGLIDESAVKMIGRDELGLAFAQQPHIPPMAHSLLTLEGESEAVRCRLLYAARPVGNNIVRSIL